MQSFMTQTKTKARSRSAAIPGSAEYLELLDEIATKWAVKADRLARRRRAHVRAKPLH